MDEAAGAQKREFEGLVYEDINEMLFKLYKVAEYGSFGLDINGTPDPTLR